MRQLFALCLITTMLSACASIGRPFDISKADQLVPGVSNEADAIKLLGEPVARKKDETGQNDKFLWSYAYGTALATGGASKLVILFDGNGTMIKVLETAQI